MLKAQEAAEAKRCGLEDKLKKRTDRWLDAYDTWLQVEKFDHKIDMGLFADKFREEYELLYHHQDNIAGYEEAVSAFDEYVEAIQISYLVLTHFVAMLSQATGKQQLLCLLWRR